VDNKDREREMEGEEEGERDGGKEGGRERESRGVEEASHEHGWVWRRK